MTEAFTWLLIPFVVLMAAAMIRRNDMLTGLAFAMPVAVLSGVAILGCVVRLTPVTIDTALCTRSETFVYGWALRHSEIAAAFNWIYLSLGIAIALAIAVARHPARVAVILLLAAFLAIPIYLLFPARGPAFAAIPDAARNCIPSLHCSWSALLAITAARRFRRWFALFSALTVIATLTTGQHYLIDVFASVPFVALALWVVRLAENTNYAKYWRSYGKVTA